MIKYLHVAAINLKKLCDYLSYTNKTWQVYVNINV